MNNKKDNDCIHCGKPPYPVCPECNAFWSSGARGQRWGCICCGYKPTDEEMSKVLDIATKYKERNKAEPSLAEEARQRYDLLHASFLDAVKMKTGSNDILALTQALEIARAGLDK